MLNMKKQQGAFLLEALIAIVLFAIGSLAVLGVQTAAATDVRQSKYRMDAGFFANQIIASMWADGVSEVPDYAVSGGVGNEKTQAWIDSVVNTLPDAASTPPSITVNDVSSGNGSSYEVVVTLTWTPPKEGVPHRYVGSAFINRNE